MNVNRRIFRGRGGPTDRRLPNSNARRRRKTKPNEPSLQGFDDDDDDDDDDDKDTANPKTNHHQSRDDTTAIPESNNSIPMDDLSLSSLEIVQQVNSKGAPSQSAINTTTTTIESTTEEKNDPCLRECQHLRRRIQNVRESIHLSAAAISNPSTYQQNVLGAILNCGAEWRSIVTHYHLIELSECNETSMDTTTIEGISFEQPEELPNSMGAHDDGEGNDHETDHESNDDVNSNHDDSDEMENEGPQRKTQTNLPSKETYTITISNDLAFQIKSTSLLLFELIQHSLQCGPLTGSNPGYFKRCGSDVAKVVYDYLNIMVPNCKSSYLLGFTSKQVHVMEEWKQKAQRAAAKNKPPSKSALKKQQQQTITPKLKKQKRKNKKAKMST